MIDIFKLTEADKGKCVILNTTKKIGRIKVWNDSYVFVVFKSSLDNYQECTGQAYYDGDLDYLSSEIQSEITHGTFKVGDRVTRKDEYHPNTSHGTICKAYSASNTQFGDYYPELYDVNWDEQYKYISYGIEYAYRGYLPHGLIKEES